MAIEPLVARRQNTAHAAAGNFSPCRITVELNFRQRWQAGDGRRTSARNIYRGVGFDTGPRRAALSQRWVVRRDGLRKRVLANARRSTRRGRALAGRDWALVGHAAI